MNKFKERIKKQKKQDEKRRWSLYHKNFTVNNLEIKVDCNATYVNEEELEMSIKDILQVTKGQVLIKDMIFNISNFSDVGFDLKFNGSKDNKLYFNVI